MKPPNESMDRALASKRSGSSRDPLDVILESGTDPSTRSKVPASRDVSVREVARRAMVSPATVSLVINENPRISPATSQRVRRVMDELGYRPNHLAQNLSRRDTRMLAVMLPPLNHAFADRYFGELLSGISDRARALDFKIMMEQSTPDFIHKRRHLELFERRFVDGVLCLGNNDNHPFLTDFVDAKYPMLVVNNYFPQWPQLDYVVCDYRAGAEQALNYLMQLGHRRIGIIGGSRRVQTARDILAVYDEKLREAGIDAPPTWRDDGLFTEAGGAEAMQRLSTRHPEITAVLAGNDKMAMGAMHYLSHANKRVPQDISVIGFDNMEHAAFVKPTLTTVNTPLYEVGVLACEKLVNRIRGSDESIRAILPAHLIVRESTGIAPNLD